MTLFLKILDCSTNSFLSFSLGIFSKFCKSSSFSTGRTITKQSFSGKYVFIKFLTLFFSSTESDVPFTFSKAFSKYCFSVITFPFLSSNFKEKSLKSQSKVGKYSPRSSSLSSLFTLLIFIDLLKFTIKLKVFKVISSIAPKELKMNKELIKTDIRNIFES